MFDIGWGELFLIGVVALIVVGPKELPGLFRTVGQWTGKARMMAREFQRSLEQAANESGMNEVSQSLKGLDTLRSPGQAARNYAAKTMASGDTAPNPAVKPAASKPAEAAPAPAEGVTAEAADAPAPAEATPVAEAADAAQGPKSSAL